MLFRNIKEEGIEMNRPSYGPSGSQNERKLTAQVFIQHHGAVQPHTTIPMLTRAPLRP